MKYFVQTTSVLFFIIGLLPLSFSQQKTVELKIKQTYNNGSVVLVDTTFVITDESQIEDLLDYFEAKAPEVAHSPRYVIRPRNADAPSILNHDGEKEDSRDDERLIVGIYPDGNFRGNGIRVQSIINGTAAEGAGLKSGDVITHVDGWEVKNIQELRKLLDHFQMGEAIVIEYERRGETFSGMGRLTHEKPTAKNHDQNQRYQVTPKVAEPRVSPDPRPRVSISHTNREKRVMLGVYPENLTRRKAASLDFPDDRGVYLTGIVSKSAAAYAGIRKGDIITRIDGHWLDNTSDLHNVLKAYDPGDRVEVSIWRDGRNRTLVARLKGKDGSYGSNEDREDERDRRWQQNQNRNNNNPRIIIIPDEEDRNERPRTRAEGRAYMGVYLSSSYRGGAYLSGVISNGAAEDAGLRKGDVILYLDRNEINDDDDLKDVLSDLSPGERVRVIYKRNGDERETMIRLGHKR